jgi:hypothetical protein
MKQARLFTIAILLVAAMAGWAVAAAWTQKSTTQKSTNDGAQTPGAEKVPVGHWTFDEPAGSQRAADSSGSKNDARCGAGAPELGKCPQFGIAGKLGSAASFAGGQFLTVKNTIPGTFTIAAWIKTADKGAGDPGDRAFEGDGIIWSDTAGPAPDMIPMALIAGHVGFGTGECPGREYNTLTSKAAVNTGEWVHVAVTRDTTSGAKQLYINGRLDSSNDQGGTCSLNSTPVITFGANPLDGRFFKGQMDDVYFFDRVLSAPEIASLATMLQRKDHY